MAAETVKHETYLHITSIRTWTWRCSCGAEGKRNYHSAALARRMGVEHEKENTESKGHDWSKGEPLDLSGQEQKRQRADNLDREAGDVQVKGIVAPNMDKLASKVQEFLWANDLKMGEFILQMEWRDAQNVTALIIFR